MCGFLFNYYTFVYVGSYFIFIIMLLLYIICLVLFFNITNFIELHQWLLYNQI